MKTHISDNGLLMKVETVKEIPNGAEFEGFGLYVNPSQNYANAARVAYYWVSVFGYITLGK